MRYFMTYNVFENSSNINYDTIVNGYLEAALWLKDEEIEDDLSIYDFADSSKFNVMMDVIKLVKLVNSKLEDNGLILGDGISESQFGHDFWLTRTGQGSGFWDRKEYEVNGMGDWISDIIDKNFSESVYLYVGDDGKAHIE